MINTFHHKIFSVNSLAETKTLTNKHMENRYTDKKTRTLRKQLPYSHTRKLKTKKYTRDMIWILRFLRSTPKYIRCATSSSVWRFFHEVASNFCLDGKRLRSDCFWCDNQYFTFPLISKVNVRHNVILSACLYDHVYYWTYCVILLIQVQLVYKHGKIS